MWTALTKPAGLLFALQALLLPADSPTQLQTVQFPYFDTWGIRVRWGGYSPGYKLIVMPTGLIASGALRNGLSKCRVHSHTKSMRTWFTCTGSVMAMQMQLWSSTGEDIRCAEHQTGLFLPTCFVHYVSVGHFLVHMCHQNADWYKQLRNRKKL